MLLLALLSCAPKAAEPVPQPVVVAPPPQPAWALDVLAAMDTKVNPCDDFYQYACGGWITNNPLPADKAVWSRFSTIRDANLVKMQEILEKAAANPAGGDADYQKMGQFYGSCMDTEAVNATGTEALAPLLAQITAMKSAKEFMKVAGGISASGIEPLVTSGVDGDYKNPAMSILYLSEGGLALPDRDYYLKTDEESKSLVAAYKKHVAAMLVFAGTPTDTAEKSAGAVVDFEAKIAEAWVPRAELRDPDKTYNKLDRKGLVKLTPALDWTGWLAAAGGKDANDIVVEVPEVFKKLEIIVKKTPVETLRAYLRWQVIHGLAAQLSEPIFQENFDMFNRKVLGAKEPEPRWKRCAMATDTAMGEITGKYWVAEKFPGDSKDKAVAMIKDIEDSFAAGLPKLAWMDEPTRAKAVEKKDKVVNKIGFPDQWRDYGGLAVSPGHHGINVVASRQFEVARQWKKVGQAADKGEWFMTAPTVNAYYNATLNEMVFPAGILQSPFFSRDFPISLNYGAMGSVMGHELSHGFDDQGRKFDGDGKMSEWWPADVTARYESQASCVKSQFDGYSVGPDLPVNGALTLGENIADLGGSRTSFRAYKARRGAESSQTVPNLSEDQLFFVAYAQAWCTVASPQWEKMLVLSNPHSPQRFRANGPLSNLPEFSETFSCAEGTAMHPKTRCEVW